MCRNVLRVGKLLRDISSLVSGRKSAVTRGFYAYAVGRKKNVSFIVNRETSRKTTRKKPLPTCVALFITPLPHLCYNAAVVPPLSSSPLWSPLSCIKFSSDTEHPDAYRLHSIPPCSGLPRFVYDCVLFVIVLFCFSFRCGSMFPLFLLVVVSGRCTLVSLR